MNKWLQFSIGILITALIFFVGFYFINRQTKSINSAANETLQVTSLTKNIENSNTTGDESKEAIITEKSKIIEKKEMTKVIIHTNKGDITVELLDNKPKTTENFLKLAESGFYNNVRFHRVIQGFMIQAGDPLSKDASMVNAWGTGGPGYKFEDELTGGEKYDFGTLAMANSGPNTNGSQFFIVTAQPLVSLPPLYTVFGKVTSGQEVTLQIEKVATNSNDRPLEDVIIISMEIVK